MEVYAVKRPDGTLMAESLAGRVYDAMWFGRSRDTEMRRSKSAGYSVVKLVEGEMTDPEIYVWCIARPDGTIINDNPWYPPSDVWFAWCDSVRLDPALHELNEKWRAEHDGKSFFHDRFGKQDDFEGYTARKVYLVEEK